MEHDLDPATLSLLNTLELRSKKIVEGIRSGLHTSPHKGMSVEFKQHRSYSPGDNLRHLDWKVFARSDRPAIKQYEQETILDVEVLIDCSGSMGFGSIPTKPKKRNTKWSKYDYCSAITLALTWLIIQNSDRVGVSIFSNGITGSIPKSSARNQLENVINTLTREPTDSKTNLIKTTEQALAKCKRKSLFIILSDFLTESESINTSLAMFSRRKHDVVCIQTLDDEEMHLKNKKMTSFQGMESDGKIQIDPNSIRNTYTRLLNDHIESITESANLFGFDHQVFNTHKPMGPPLANLLTNRKGWLNRHNAS